MNDFIKINKAFRPEKHQVVNILDRIKSCFEKNTLERITGINEISEGQNQNYQLVCESSNKYLLKIITNKGYPDIESTWQCYKYLQEIGLGYYEIKDLDLSADIVPHGYFIQRWIEGVSAEKHFNRSYEAMCDDKDDQKWIIDYAKILNKVHEIMLDSFGYIGGLSFPTLEEYFNNIDQIVMHSFGGTFRKKISLWDLCENSIIPREFLEDMFKEIRKLTVGKFQDKKSVLVYGDMFPMNVIYNDGKPVLIDWDEARANWWVYELARTMYYIKSMPLAEKFLTHYHHEDTFEEIDIGIRLEHIKQDLRQIYFVLLRYDADNEIKSKVNSIMKKIEQSLCNRFLTI